MSDQRADSIPYSGIPCARNREFPNAYQGKFFKEQGIDTLISGAAAGPAEHARRVGSMSAYWDKADSRWTLPGCLLMTLVRRRRNILTSAAPSPRMRCTGHMEYREACRQTWHTPATRRNSVARICARTRVRHRSIPPRVSDRESPRSGARPGAMLMATVA